jgi:hypothetical protein
MIGFDLNSGLAYEGISNYGHGVWPAPIVLRATIIKDEADWGNLPSSGSIREAKVVFREDYFDPVTRIRRGRFYEWQDGKTQPENWWVQGHPVLNEETGRRNEQGLFFKTLVSFTPAQNLGTLFDLPVRPLIVLGARPSITVWSVVAIERSGHDEDLFTLRARGNFGFLPDLILEAIPASARKRVSEAVSKVADAAHRQSGIAVVDLCRDATTLVLAEYLVSQGAPQTLLEKDLADVVRAMPDARLRTSAAEVVRLLHPRGKSNEMHKYGTRAVNDSDGRFALEALGFLLRDLGWAA